MGVKKYGGSLFSGRFKMVVGISNSFYLVFSPCLAPLPNFILIGQKTQKLEIFTFGQLWLVGLVGRKMVVGISNSFYLVFASFLAPMPNFIQIGQETQKLGIFTFGRLWLVRLVGRKMVIGIPNPFYLVFFLHFKPPFQISSKSDKKHRS